MARIHEIVAFLTLVLSPTVRAFTTIERRSNTKIHPSSALSVAGLPITDVEAHSVSKYAFDVIPFIVDPEDTIVIRLVAMAAKSFGVATGVSNENVNYDDLAFNSVALVVSVTLFSRSFIPVIKTLFTNHDDSPNFLDNKNAYRKLFEPLGLSELNFKILNANGAFEWIDIEPSQSITLSESERKTFEMRTDLNCLTKTALDDNIYWLGDGSMQVMIGDTNVKDIKRDANYRDAVDDDDDDDDDFDDETDLIFGNVFGTNFVKSREQEVSNGTVATATIAPPTTLKKWIRAGENGARILRINGERVFDLMENDGKLSSCIQNLVFMGVCHELRDISNGEFETECDDIESCALGGQCELDDDGNLDFEQCAL